MSRGSPGLVDAPQGIDRLLHRVRVGHGFPAFAAPLLDAVERLTRGRRERRVRDRTLAEAENVRALHVGRDLRLLVDRLPPGLAAPSRIVTIPTAAVVGGITCDAREQTPDSLRALAEHLVTRGRASLQAIPIAEILRVLGRASLLWLDPGYQRRGTAIEAIHRITGFSREMIIHAIDLEMLSSRWLDLWRTLWTELGNPRVLDRPGWAPTGEAHAAAFGPALVAAVFSSNIPALPHLSYMRALAVKAPVLGKVATFEPVFAGLYLDTLAELCPALGPALAAVWFQGGTVPLERALLERAEHVIAYGSERTLEALSGQIPSGARCSLHGHRMGVGLVSREALAAPDLPRRIGYDVAVFDGQACLAPMVFFVEASRMDEGARLAEQVGDALETTWSWLPRRALGVEAKAARRATIDRWESAEIFGGGRIRLVRSAALGAPWAACVSQGTYEPQPVADRLLHVQVVERLEDVLSLLIPYRRYLQNVAIEAPPARRRALAVEISALGASRITRAGRMPTPSMMWHHDGRLCLADLVRWSDIG
jgi:hypothetical protein